MTDPNYTHWHLIVDRSGSMASVKDDAQGGINEAFKAQRKLPGKLTVTLTQFDTVVETLSRVVDISAVEAYELVPRGSTALLDAVGRAIVETGEDLSKLPEDQRPSKVLVQIVTDGHENASREWTLDEVRDMIKRQHEDFGWIFAFWGADDAAWMGRTLGTQSVTSYAGTRGGTRSMATNSSDSLSGLRSAGVYDAPERIDDPTEKK